MRFGRGQRQGPSKRLAAESVWWTVWVEVAVSNVGPGCAVGRAHRFGEDRASRNSEPPQNPDCDSERIIRSKFFEERPTVTTSVRHSPPWSMLSEGWG